MATKKKNSSDSRYAYTVSPGKMADDKFDIEAMKKGEADMRVSASPDQKAMRYVQDDSLSGVMNPKAGAGRGGQGGPSAKELRDEERRQNRGIYTAEMGAPPQEPEGMKRGGKVSSASRRADGIAQRGKTRGTMIMCGGGYAKGK
jgi:hypothetical protein